jgi:phosphoribosylaminoimidazole carboxylase PurE protein
VKAEMKKAKTGPKPIVAVVMGSKSDEAVMAGATQALEEMGLSYEVKVMSAHRQPAAVAKFAKEAKKRGIKIIIAGAGLAAHLPGVIASYTDLPVIGVPIAAGSLNGLDALLSIVQMPKGVPVATVGINNSANAALLAARILLSA